MAASHHNIIPSSGSARPPKGRKSQSFNLESSWVANSNQSSAPHHCRNQPQRPKDLNKASSFHKVTNKRGSLDSVSSAKSVAMAKMGRMKSLGGALSRPFSQVLGLADVRETQQEESESDTVFVSHDGMLQLGCVLEMIRNLLSVHEVKCALDLLEDFVNSRPAKYKLDVSADDFVHDLRCSTDSLFGVAANLKEEPMRIIQEVVSQTRAQLMRAGNGSSYRRTQPIFDAKEDPPYRKTAPIFDVKEDTHAAKASDGSTSGISGMPSLASMHGKLKDFEREHSGASIASVDRHRNFHTTQSNASVLEYDEGWCSPQDELALSRRVAWTSSPEGAISECSETSKHCAILKESSKEKEEMSPEDTGESLTSNEDQDATKIEGAIEEHQTTSSSLVGALPNFQNASNGNGGMVHVQSDVSIIKEVSKERSDLSFIREISKERRLAADQLWYEVINDFEIDLDDVSLEQAAFLATKSDQFVVHPNNKGRTSLDLVVLVLIIMECVSLPLSLSFEMYLPDTINTCALVIFSVDMVMGFTTGYYHHDLLILRRRRIVKNYLQTWFFLDFTSLFPWESVFAAASLTGGAGENGGTRTTFVRILKLGKLLRVLRLLRMAKITALVKRLQSVGLLPADLSKLKFGVAIAKMFVIFGLLSHWAACVWGWLGDPSNVGHAVEDKLPHKIDECTMGGPCEGGIEGTPWRYRYGLQQNYNSMTQYFAALQFTAGLITGGDTPMQAGGPVERMFSILVMFCSVCVISVVVGEILLIMNRRAEQSMAFDELTSQAREFMTGRKVAMQVQVRVFRYLETQHKILHGHSSANREFFAHLSDELQKELIEQVNSEILVQHPFFMRICNNYEAMQQLCLEASPVIFAATENVVEKGSPATSCHFIVTGKVRVEAPVVTGGKVLYLRACSWVGDVCLFLDTLRNATVTAVIVTETLMLPKSVLATVCELHEDVQAEFVTFQEQIRNDKFDSLLCPICHDFGHCAKACPKGKDGRFPHKRQFSNNRFRSYREKITSVVLDSVLPSRSSKKSRDSEINKFRGSAIT